MTYVMILDSRRDFQPDYSQLGDVLSIGSGNDAACLSDALRAIRSAPFSLAQAEINCNGGMGNAWAGSMARLLRQSSVPGVSQCVHHFQVWRDKAKIRPHLTTRYSSDGEVKQLAGEYFKCVSKCASDWRSYLNDRA